MELIIPLRPMTPREIDSLTMAAVYMLDKNYILGL